MAIAKVAEIFVDGEYATQLAHPVNQLLRRCFQVRNPIVNF